jgi:hypothetical protein
MVKECVKAEMRLGDSGFGIRDWEPEEATTSLEKRRGLLSTDGHGCRTEKNRHRLNHIEPQRAQRAQRAAQRLGFPGLEAPSHSAVSADEKRASPHSAHTVRDAGASREAGNKRTIRPNSMLTRRWRALEGQRSASGACAPAVSAGNWLW